MNFGRFDAPPAIILLMPILQNFSFCLILSSIMCTNLDNDIYNSHEGRILPRSAIFTYCLNISISGPNLQMLYTGQNLDLAKNISSTHL